MRRACVLLLLLGACDETDPASAGTTGDASSSSESTAGESTSTGEGAWDGDTVAVRVVQTNRTCAVGCGESECVSATNLSHSEGATTTCEQAPLLGVQYECICADSPDESLLAPTHAVSDCLDASAYPNPMGSCDAWCDAEGLGECAWAYASNGCLEVPGGEYEYVLPDGGGDYDGGANNLRFVCEL